MDANKLKNILEAGLLVAGRTLSVAQLEALFQHDSEKPERKQIREALESLKQDYEGRGIELVEVASGFRLQSHESVSDWVANLFQEKTPRYSRALLETLVLIAYRQPITRAEIEDVRGVAVSSNIIKTLQERQWVKVLGHKEVPGRPALLGTTKEFLDYFNLKKLDELPSLADIKDLDQFDELLAEEAGEAEEQGDDAGDGEVNGTTRQVNGSGEITPSGGSGGDSSNSNVAFDSGDAGIQEANDVSDNSDQDVDANNDDDEAGSAQLAGRTESDLDSDTDTDKTEHSGSDRKHIDDDEDDGAPEHNETLSAPELELLRVISDFSDEHQQEVDARDAMEATLSSSKNDDVDEPDSDVADLSQRVGDDRHAGDMPEPGDTLH